MKLLMLLIIVLITFFVSGCDPTDNRFTIVNETERPLFYTTSPYDTIEGNSPFQTFFEISNKDSVWIESDYFIKPKGEKKKMVMSDWEEMVEKNFNGKIYVFIFDADTLQQYTWDEIKRNNKFVHKYKFGVEELKKVDWKVRVKK